MTKRELKRAKKRAMASKMENLEPTYCSPTVSSKPAMTISQKNGPTIQTYWEKNEVVEDGIDNDNLFHKTMKDSAGKFEFIIEKSGEDVLVTIEGTHHREHKMSKRQAFWEWDMIWEDIGCPKVLQ